MVDPTGEYEKRALRLDAIGAQFSLSSIAKTLPADIVKRVGSCRVMHILTVMVLAMPTLRLEG